MLSLEGARKLSSSKSLHDGRTSLFAAVRDFVSKHRTPYGLIFVQNGRGHKVQQEHAFMEFGHGLSLICPAAQVVLLDLIDRVTDPVFCLGAEAELTSLSAAKLGTPDWDQIFRILVEMKCIDEERAGMVQDALESLYLSTNQEGLQSSQRKGAKERRGGGKGVTRQEVTDFYVRLDATVKQKHGEQNQRHAITQHNAAICVQDGSPAACQQMRDRAMQAREVQRRNESGNSNGPDNHHAPEGQGGAPTADAPPAPSSTVPPSNSDNPGPSSAGGARAAEGGVPMPATAAPHAPPLSQPSSSANAASAAGSQAPPGVVPTAPASASSAPPTSLPSSSAADAAPPGPKKRGRPKGSKNRQQLPQKVSAQEDPSQGLAKPQRKAKEMAAGRWRSLNDCSEESGSDSDDEYNPTQENDQGGREDLLNGARAALLKPQQDIAELEGLIASFERLPTPRPHWYCHWLNTLKNAKAEFLRD